MRSIVPATVAGMIFLAAGGLAAQEFSDRAVGQAIDKAVQHLWSQQQADGSWPIYARYKTGPTALAVYALLEAGADFQDPRMAKALKFLVDNPEDFTYVLGLRCQVWLAAMRRDKTYADRLQEDVHILYASTKEGSYGYVSKGDGTSAGDNSNSQYGLLGVWAGARGDIDVPREYWQKVMRHWVNVQIAADGGWQYGGQGQASKDTMTAAGVASLYVCFDNLFADKFVRCDVPPEFEPISRGLAWMDKNFAASVRGSPNYYYLYGVERVGLACGYKYFGENDWYKLGASQLLRVQQMDGSFPGQYAGPISTSFAVLFLVRGRHAVLFNKLQFNGDWNNRPRDLANLTWWISRTFESTVNWQIINLGVPVREWHDAPILYISAAKDPNFSDEDIAKLRTYVLQGGTIFSSTQCGGAGFTEGIRKVYQRMFPAYPLTACPGEHEIYSAYYSLKGQPRFWIVTNGVRPLAVHTDTDLPLTWQTRNYKQLFAFEAASNVFMYVTDRGALRARGVSLWPEEPAGAPARTIRLARLKHNATCDPEPLAFERLHRLMVRETGTGLDIAGPLGAEELSASGASVAVMTGVGKLSLSAAEQAALAKWVNDGGTLIVDAAGGNAEFAASAEQAIDAMFGGTAGRRALRRLALSSPVYQLQADGKDLRIDSVRYRRRTIPRVGRENSRYPSLRAVMLGNRAAVIFSREDLTAGLLGSATSTVDGYDPGGPEDFGSAYRLMRNAILYGAGQGASGAASQPAAAAVR